MIQNSFIDRTQNIGNDFFSFLQSLLNREKKFLILGDLSEAFHEFKKNNQIENPELDDIIRHLQECFVLDNSIHLDVRVKIGYSEFYCVNMEEQLIEPISIKQYLIRKEKFINPNFSNNILTIDFKPFYDKNPSVRDIKNIGAGVEYLNKFLSSEMFTNLDKWRDLLMNFLKLHKHNNQQLILNDRINNAEHLNENIKKANRILSELNSSEPYKNIKHQMQNLGFEIGLGKDAGNILENLDLLDTLLNSPDNSSLKDFISRIPMIFNIAVVSVHGYFAQENILGRPDTGGQVVYILDQVKALEKELINTLKQSGLNVLPKIVILTRLIPNAGDTNCNVRLEKVTNTKNTWILRVPFRNHNPKVTDNWISRFEIWPYLEEFAEDSYTALKAEFNGRPDLVIGNYSDGNLVSYLISKKFGVTQCCIAHALEKSKYLFSDLYWNDLEDQYNFSIQFTADLIAMNSSNFQITSTYQEIAGTEFTVGQYETHKHFTLPGLYRVENGINLYDTKFNVISPGVNERIYFPFTKKSNRIKSLQETLNGLLFGNTEDSDIFGTLENSERIPLFSMARLDVNKNLASLARWFGESKELQEISNLILIAGRINTNDSSDKEEIEQINLMHHYIEKYNLQNKIRWIGKLFRKDEAGEVYRVIADHKGFFVQPGLFEGFGLTVLESMNSGLPVIATKYGGPLEIIQNGVNGYHIDPVNDDESIRVLTEIVSRSKNNPVVWEKLSEASIKRVQEKYNWRLYSKKLLSQSKIYGFWKYSTDLENTGKDAYLDLIYHLLYRPRAQRLFLKHNSTES
ncbi:MAG: sucrose synthase [Melioribacteraceae bacterium]|nr:sucrose synthase [Melioribacteraceae bacterium]